MHALVADVGQAVLETHTTLTTGLLASTPPCATGESSHDEEHWNKNEKQSKSTDDRDVHSTEAKQPVDVVAPICPFDARSKKHHHHELDGLAEEMKILTLDEGKVGGGGGVEVELYPDLPELPWHFSWIDDGMVGGMSAPVERGHWKALRELGVGLVVNLTEAPICPPEREGWTGGVGGGGFRICEECGFVDESCEPDIFDDMSTDTPIQALFLPIPDGSIPSFTQLKTFIHHTRATVSQNLKVVVHCQAGVGRTGIFLAVHLMEKYRCGAKTAMEMLRNVRPQSMQFHPVDWQSEPFLVHGEVSLYQRNLLQERFLERYWDFFVDGSRWGVWGDDGRFLGGGGWEEVPRGVEGGEEIVRRVLEGLPRPFTALEHSPEFLRVIDDQLDQRMAVANRPTFSPIPITDISPSRHEDSVPSLSSSVESAAPSIETSEDDDDDHHLLPDRHSWCPSASYRRAIDQRFTCFVCRGVSIVGPEPVVRRRPWPRRFLEPTVGFMPGHGGVDAGVGAAVPSSKYVGREGDALGGDCGSSGEEEEEEEALRRSQSPS
ncbi:hypothetical protein HDU67_008536 [Dinochytrium kinnereticum]|nr:hypothetical protein HDU67_008536 [Dinochytrium kinnereticum]